MARYYYRIDKCSALGKQFRSLWNDCIKAEKAQESFARRIGAKSFTEPTAYFTGGVQELIFPADMTIDERTWQQAGKDSETQETLWVPNVRKSSGCVISPRKGWKPSSTATRIYGTKPMTWQQACLIYTTQKWAEMANIPLSGDAAQDRQQVEESLCNEIFWNYVEIQGSKDLLPRQRMPEWMRRAVSAERERLLLPVVRVERIYKLLQAEFTNGKTPSSTPTFFEYGGRYYIGVGCKCLHENLESITEGTYNLKGTSLMIYNRDHNQYNEDGGLFN